MKAKPFKYDVALSFAEEDRAFVDCVAKKLRENKVRVFYDDFERIQTWGGDLYTLLDRIYRREARFCVVFISRYYKEKYWTRYEVRSALIRAKAERKEYLLPFRIDSAEIPEIRNEKTHFTSDQYDCSSLAAAIMDKIKLDKQTRLPGKLRRFFFNRWRLTTLTGTTLGLLGWSVADHLTPVDTLTRRLYENSRVHIKGSVCKDGSFSRSRGSGTCSHHGGVMGKKDTLIYRKTLEECRLEALEISWLSE